jgi:hypothetical protein
VAALVLIAPVGFGRIHLAEAIQLPGVRGLVRRGLPVALANPVTAVGVYMAVVGNGHRPDPELVARLRQNAHRWVPGAECANRRSPPQGSRPARFTAASSTTTGRYWRYGAITTESSRSLTATGS